MKAISHACPRCKGRGHIITDVMAGSTKPCPDCSVPKDLYVDTAAAVQAPNPMAYPNMAMIQTYPVNVEDILGAIHELCQNFTEANARVVASKYYSLRNIIAGPYSCSPVVTGGRMSVPLGHVSMGPAGVQTRKT